MLSSDIVSAFVDVIKPTLSKLLYGNSTTFERLQATAAFALQAEVITQSYCIYLLEQPTCIDRITKFYLARIELKVNVRIYHMRVL